MAEQNSNNRTTLGTREEQAQGPSGGFSRQSRSPRPSLNRAYKKDADTTSGALKQLANTGAELYTGFQSQRIKNRQNELQDVAARDARGLLDPQEAAILERTNKTFDKYFSARRQGAMTDAATNIAVEAEMKRISNQYPALGAAVRKSAAQKLGFDPTGAEWSFLTNPPAQQQQAPETALQKAVREAEYAEQATGLTPGTLQEQVMQNYTDQLRVQGMEQQQEIGNLSSAGVTNLYNTKASVAMSQISSDLYTKMQEQGNLNDADIQSVQARMETQKNQGIATLRKQLTQQNVAPSQITARVNSYAERWDEASTSLNEMKGSKFANADTEYRTAYFENFAKKNFPLINLAEKLGYRSAEDKNAFMSILQNPDSEINKALINTSPVLRSMQENGNLASGLSKTLEGVMSGNPDMVRQAGTDPRVAGKTVAQGMLRNPRAANMGGGKAGEDALSFLRGNGDEQFALDEIAYNPSQYVSNQGVVRHLKSITNDVTLSQIADSIRSEAGKNFQFKIQDGGITYDVPNKADASTWAGSAANFALQRSGIGFASRMAEKAGALPFDVAKSAFYDASDYVEHVEALGRIMSVPQMSEKVGMSRGQLVAKLNNMIQSDPNESGNPMSNEDNPRLTPVTVEETDSAANSNDIDPAYFNRLIQTESAGGTSRTYSSADAAGVAQFMPDTAREMGLKVNDQVDERLDNEKSLNASAKYIKKLKDQFNGDYVLATMAYNWGPGALREMLDSGNPSPDIPQETIGHVQKTMGVDVLPYLRQKGLIPTY